MACTELPGGGYKLSSYDSSGWKELAATAIQLMTMKRQVTMTRKGKASSISIVLSPQISDHCVFLLSTFNFIRSQ